MLFSGLNIHDPDGRVRAYNVLATATPAGASFNRGVAFDPVLQAVYVSSSAPSADDIFIEGLRVSPTGIVLFDSTGVVQHAPGGVGIAASGAINVTTAAPDLILAGVGMMNDGSVCMNTSVTPLTPFSNGFSNGFGP